MLDYAGLRAVAAVAQTGSFDKAAQQLSVTPSAVSQRVKQIEERLGVVLIARGQPCTATEAGDWLCRHMERVGILEGELFSQMPGLFADADRQPVTLHIAVNADSLGTWFIDALAAYARKSDHLISLAIDDQDHTAEWLAKGRVVAAVTSIDKPVAGCRHVALGSLRYRATASPDFMARYFGAGVTAEALQRAPALMFNQKDRLQSKWIEQVLGHAVHHPAHWLPATQAFVDGAIAGLGWGMNPETLVRDHLAAGRLVELVADTPVDIALNWQVSRLSVDALYGLTREVVAAARGSLVVGTASALPRSLAPTGNQTGGKSMAVQNAKTEKGKTAAKGLLNAAAKEERKVEAKTGKDLPKGAKRVEERSKSSDGKSAGSKQK